MKTSDYLSIAEASAYCGKAKTTLRNAINRGVLPSVRVVGKIAIKRGDLDDYCARAKPGRPKKDSHTKSTEEP